MHAILLLDFACLLKRVSLPKWLPHTPLHRNCHPPMLPSALPPTKYPQTLQTYFSSRLSWSSPTRLLRTCSLQCSPYTVPAISSSNLNSENGHLVKFGDFKHGHLVTFDNLKGWPSPHQHHPKNCPLWNFALALRYQWLCDLPQSP